MQMLEKEGVPTHFVEELSDRDTLVKKVSIVPLEVIVRNISAGHFASRYGVEEGIVFDTPPSSSPISATRWTTPCSTSTTPGAEAGHQRGD
jgi:phosphoribosylaminoimidazole-succinocarboxamide synthase